jgi:hypothetical protein
MPGSHEVCPICRWEDDMAQLRFARMAGSANPESLEDAQRNFAVFGCSSQRNRQRSRPPLRTETRDPQWRPLDPARDNIEYPERGVKYADSYPTGNTTVLYYWRETFWRRLAS